MTPGLMRFKTSLNTCIGNLHFEVWFLHFIAIFPIVLKNANATITKYCICFFTKQMHLMLRMNEESLSLQQGHPL